MAKTYEASFEYLQWCELYEEEKPYEVFLDDITRLGGVERTNLEFKRGPTQRAYDVRGEEQSYTLDTHGFAWIKNEVDVKDLRSEEGILRTYIPAMESLLRKEVEGADRVVIFDWRTRLSSSKEEFARRAVDLNNGLDPLQPVAHPHVDQTPEGSIARAFHHLGPEAEALLKGRYRIMNVWRPLDVVEDWPLAVCDGRSVRQEDLVASDFVRRDYQGESYFAMFNESHRWHFMSKQGPDDALLFKVFDSSDSVESQFCLHASFPILEDTGPKRPRESIECRALVFTHAKEGTDGRTQDGAVGHEAHVRDLPMIYGTAWKSAGTTKAVLSAMKAGFRAFDTAAQPKHYDEFLMGESIRQAISEDLAERSQLWIQTKFSNIESRSESSLPYDTSAPIADQVRCSVESSLANLTTGENTYLDAVILHAPLATMEETSEAWNALCAFIPHKVRHLGISKTTVAILSLLYEKAHIKPTIVQNMFCKQTKYDPQVRQFCRNRGIMYQGFGILKNNSDLLRSDAVQRLANAVSVSVEQALFAMVRAMDIVPLNGTTSEEHMLGDLLALSSVEAWRDDASNKAAWEAIMRDFESTIG